MCSVHHKPTSVDQATLRGDAAVVPRVTGVFAPVYCVGVAQVFPSMPAKDTFLFSFMGFRAGRRRRGYSCLWCILLDVDAS